MADELTPAVFDPLLGTAFEVVDVGDAPFELVLDSLVEHPPVPGAPRAQAFSLIFVGPTGGYLPQRIYHLRHATAGEMDIFLVPLGPRSDGHHQYEAAFN
jgi:hypothetical protein